MTGPVLRAARALAWALMATLGLVVAIVSLRYFALDPALFFDRQREVYQANLAKFLSHAGGGIGGLIMATLAYGGLPARSGFGFLALLWLATGALAYRAIRGGQVARHREWMIRNYALTFVAAAAAAGD